MIPRTKVNYSWMDLLRAAFRSERSHAQRDRLEKMVADYAEGGEVWLTASGRAGLYAAIKASGRPRVLAPAYTCKAVAEAIRFAGAQPIWIDTEPTGFNMSADAVRRELARLPRGSAVVLATHQYGAGCDVEAMLAAARSHDALMIEDVSGALGSRVAGRPAGAWGDAAVFSFDSTKLLHAPLKAGALVVKNPDLQTRVRELVDSQPGSMSWVSKWKTLALAAVLLLIEHPWMYAAFHWWVFRRRGRFMLDAPGMQPEIDDKYRLRCTEWQAGIVAPQFAELPRYVASRQLLYELYQRELAGTPGLELPPADDRREWSCVRFPILVQGDKQAFYQRCVELGVDLAFSFTYLAEPGTEARADRIAATVVNPPFYEKLTSEECLRVVAALRKASQGVESGEDARPLQHGAEPTAAQAVVLQP